MLSVLVFVRPREDERADNSSCIFSLKIVSWSDITQNVYMTVKFGNQKLIIFTKITSNNYIPKFTHQ